MHVRMRRIFRLLRITTSILSSSACRWKKKEKWGENLIGNLVHSQLKHYAPKMRKTIETSRRFMQLSICSTFVLRDAWTFTVRDAARLLRSAEYVDDLCGFVYIQMKLKERRRKLFAKLQLKWNYAKRTSNNCVFNASLYEGTRKYPTNRFINFNPMTQHFSWWYS